MHTHYVSTDIEPWIIVIDKSQELSLNYSPESYLLNLKVAQLLIG